MKFTLSLLFLINIIAISSFGQERYSKVKIYCTNEQLLQLSNSGIEADHGERKWNTFLITDISESELELISNLGMNYEIIADDVKQYYAERNNSGSPKNVTCSGTIADDLPEVPANFYQNSSYAGFYKYQDMLDALDEMAAQYPNLITVKAPISTFLTHEGRPIYHVKISDNPGTDEGSETKVLYTAIHHAREPLSMSQLIFYMWYILQNYSNNEEIQYLVDNTELYFVPCLNPDGYLHNEANDPGGFGMHRKNKRNVGTSNPGVDNNRNYSYGWNTTGVSPDPNNDTYPGTSAFSEPENQAIKWLVENIHFTSSFNAHTYGNTLLYPIGTTEAEFADHHDYFADLSAHMCLHNGFFPQKSSGLYPASGDSDDYMYKSDIGVGEKDTIFAWTPEIGTDFWPAQNEILPTCQGMIFPNLVLAHMTHRYVHVKDDDPQLIASSIGDFDHIATRYGLVDGPVEVSITPLLNIQTVGSPVQYDLDIREVASGSISYVLSPSIQLGDEVKYVLNTVYPDWTKHDTVTKIFGALTVQLSENGDSGANWSGTWSTTSSDYYSASSSFTDSDGADYPDNADKKYTFNPTIDLSNATDARISFYAKWEIEADYDYCQFQVSTDNGASWEGQCGSHTVEGSSTFWNGSAQPNGEPVWEGTSDWVYEEINLSDYLGQQIKVRFQLESDGGVRRDGFYFDDFSVSFNEGSGLSLDELSGMELKVFPNPASESATVYTDTYLDQGTRVLIFDNSGKLALEQIIDHKTNQIELGLTGIAKGFYTVELRTEQGVLGQTKMVVR